MERTWNQPLPRGRHHLSREEVAASQRQRILLAMLEEVASRGYAATSVAHITSRAGVSRKSFYEQFTDKEDCYFAAFDMAGKHLAANVAKAVGDIDPSANPVAYFRATLRAFLESIAAAPAASRTLLVELYAVGPEAVRRKVGLHESVMATLFAPLGVADGTGRLTFEGQAVLNSIAAMVTRYVAEGRTEEVPSLCDPFVDWVERHLDCVPAGAAGSADRTSRSAPQSSPATA
jgi:AcrR family transcriptional regulator